MRLAPLDVSVGNLLDFSTSADVKKMQLGTVVQCTGTDYDTTANVANWGVAEVIYVANNSVAILPGALCVIDKNFRIVASAAAATQANTGQQVYVALTNFGVGSPTEQYGWALRRGTCPVQFSVAATVGAVYAGTAGKATPTAAAGSQILSMRTLIAGASTFTRLGSTKTGSSKVKFGSVTGVYVGQAISGTGIPASSVVSSIDTDGVTVNIGSAVGTLVVATATASVTVTFTNTNFGIVNMDYPFYQGQIT